MAQIYIEDKSSYMALQSLDKCLSYNFKVRQNPIYYLLRAKCEKADGHLEEALNTLNEIMNLPSFKNNNIPSMNIYLFFKKKKKKKKKKKNTFLRYYLNQLYFILNSFFILNYIL